MRTTKKDVKIAFRNLCRVMGKAEVEWKGSAPGSLECNIGAWELDYYGMCGGYKIAETVSDGGGITFPLLSERLPAKAFVSACEMAVAAVEYYKRGQ